MLPEEGQHDLGIRNRVYMYMYMYMRKVIDRLTTDPGGVTQEV